MKGNEPMNRISLVKKQGFWYVYGDGDPKVFPTEKYALEHCYVMGWVCVDKTDCGDFAMYSMIQD